MVAVAALGIVIAIRTASQTLAMVCVASAFFAPLLMSKSIHGALALLYLAVVAAAAVYVSVRERWPVMPIVTVAIGSLCGFLSDNKAGPVAAFLWFNAVALWTARLRAAEPELLAGSLYVSGHAALLLAALSLIGDWVTPVSIALTLASVLLALYGIGLLALGVTQRSNINRLTGLSLIGLVIAKLYLYDIWQLSYGFRITAFVILGALLLGASFIYSRWKTRS